jgi:6-phosphogluconolactonase/glucosamine-6-phosphate isomerase/deaminase
VRINNFKTYQDFNTYYDNLVNNWDLNNYLLVASGGETPKLLYEHLAEAKDTIRPESIMLSDERWERKKQHEDSNELMLKNTGLLERYNSTNYHEVITGEETAKKEALRYNKVVTKLFKQYQNNHIALFGMGGDGHIAGIKAKSEATVSQKNVVFYNSKYEYRVRITITEYFIEKYIKNALLILQGKEKEQAFEEHIHNPNSPVSVLEKVENMEVGIID